MTEFFHYSPPVSASAVIAQPDRVGEEGSAGSTIDVLWLIGGGMLALLLLGFALSRRFHQRPADSPFDDDRERGGPSPPDEEPVEGLL